MLDESMQGTVRGGRDTAGLSKHGSMKTGRDGSDSMFDSMNNIDVRQSRDGRKSQRDMREGTDPNAISVGAQGLGDDTSRVDDLLAGNLMEGVKKEQEEKKQKERE